MLQTPWRDPSFSHGAEFIKIGTNPSLCDTNKKNFEDLEHKNKTWMCLTAFFKWKREAERLWGDRKVFTCSYSPSLYGWGLPIGPPTWSAVCRTVTSIRITTLLQQNRQQTKIVTPSATPISGYPLQQLRKPSIKRLIPWIMDLGDKSFPLSTKPSLEGQVNLKQYQGYLISLHQGQARTGTKNSLRNHCVLKTAKPYQIFIPCLKSCCLLFRIKRIQT